VENETYQNFKAVLSGQAPEAQKREVLMTVLFCYNDDDNPERAELIAIATAQGVPFPSPTADFAAGNVPYRQMRGIKGYAEDGNGDYNSISAIKAAVNYPPSVDWNVQWRAVDPGLADD
jgi:hypothetical protein